MILFYCILLLGVAQSSSWFSSEPDYAKWSHVELRTWLENRNIKVPPSFDRPHLYDLVDANWHSSLPPHSAYLETGRQWSLHQYSRAQRAFEHVKDDSFDKWDESRLKAILLEQGIVAPPGPREQLVLLVKNKFRAYTDTAALYSSLASASASSTHASATDAAYSASRCISHAVAQATREVTRSFDDTKDHMYSTWENNRLRSWLEDHDVLEAKNAITKDELAGLANEYYRKATSAAWESWSDSYIREWLVTHNLLKPTETPSRLSLLGEMKKYYYDFTDSVWDTWSNSELNAWLVDHDLLKDDTERNREELVRMVEEHYFSVPDSIWGAWTDSDIRQWLSEQGYLENRNDLGSRKDLVDLINSKHPDATAKVASYLAWPDARLRAYLHESGISENALPATRPGLLQETRAHWVQTSTRVENIFARLKEIVNSSMEAAEEKVARVLEVLSGHSRDLARYASEKVDDVRECADTKNTHGWSWGVRKVDQVLKDAEEVRQSAQREGQNAKADWARGSGEL